MEILGQYNTDDSRELRNHWIPLYSSQVAFQITKIQRPFSKLTIIHKSDTVSLGHQDKTK